MGFLWNIPTDYLTIGIGNPVKLGSAYTHRLTNVKGKKISGLTPCH